MGIKRIVSNLIKAIFIILKGTVKTLSPFPHHTHFTNANETFKKVCLALSQFWSNYLASFQQGNRTSLPPYQKLLCNPQGAPSRRIRVVPEAGLGNTSSTY